MKYLFLLFIVSCTEVRYAAVQSVIHISEKGIKTQNIGKPVIMPRDTSVCGISIVPIRVPKKRN